MHQRPTEYKALMAMAFLIIVFFISAQNTPHWQTIKPNNAPISYTNPVAGPHFDLTYMGKASWYGRNFHGRTTANGEIYNMNQLTAAHKTLPFGSIVKVTNLNNGTSIVVRINDRGPYITGRNIDLSYAAAMHLNMLGDGVIPVKLEIMKSSKSALAKNTPPIAER